MKIEEPKITYINSEKFEDIEEWDDISWIKQTMLQKFRCWFFKTFKI